MSNLRTMSRAELTREIASLRRDVGRLVTLCAMHRQYIQVLLKFHDTLSAHAPASVSLSHTDRNGQVVGTTDRGADSFREPSLEMLWQHAINSVALQSVL